MTTTRRADLTAAAQEYLLAFRGHGDDAGVTPSGVAKELAVSKQAAADVEARRLHAAISPEFEARLEELLGHPQTCPHGNPIDRDAAARRPQGEPLATLEAGEGATIYRVTESAEADAALLGYLEARGLVPGARITVLSRSASLDSLTLDGPIGRASLGLRPAALVQVLRGAVDATLFHQIPVRS